MIVRGSSSRRPSRPRRRGSLTVEMVMVVVVLAIITVGIVQFGVFFANAQQVALAARVGGLEASQTPDLPTAAGPVPANIISAIEHQLQSSCIDWCQIRLEHNVTPGDAAVVLQSDSGAPCDCDEKTSRPAAPAATTHYVRLTVCVPLNQVIPKQLSYFGSHLFPPEKTYEHTALFRYELTTP